MDEKGKIAYASAKPTEELLLLFERAKELEVDGLGNPEILERGGHYLVENVSSIDFKSLSGKKHLGKYQGGLPSSFKVRINDSDLYSEMVHVIQRAYNIKRVMTPFLIKVTLAAYIEYLEGSPDTVNEKAIQVSTTDDIDSLKIKAISLVLKADETILNNIINETKQSCKSIPLSIQKEVFLKNIDGDIWTNDPDDSMEARNFYSKYWKDVLSDGVGLFRGETILSFNTIAGCTIRLLPLFCDETFKMPKSSEERLLIITESKKLSDEIKELYRRFYSINHTLANFMPLMKIENCYNSYKDSPYLQYVKNKDYHEFPDLFFNAIRLHYSDKDKSNPKFSKDSNSKYFEIFGTKQDGWCNFVEKNYLQDFFEDDSNKYVKFRKLAPQNNINMPYTQKIAENLSDEEKKKCIQQIEIFVDNAVKIIENRASRLARTK